MWEFAIDRESFESFSGMSRSSLKLPESEHIFEYEKSLKSSSILLSIRFFLAQYFSVSINFIYVMTLLILKCFRFFSLCSEYINMALGSSCSLSASFCHRQGKLKHARGMIHAKSDLQNGFRRRSFVVSAIYWLSQ